MAIKPCGHRESCDGRFLGSTFPLFDFSFLFKCKVNANSFAFNPLHWMSTVQLD